MDQKGFFHFILIILLIGCTLLVVPPAVADEDFPQSTQNLKVAEAPIEAEIDSRTIRAAGFGVTASPGQVLAIRSRDPKIGIIGFVEVTASRIRPDGKVELTSRVLRLSRYNLVRPSDYLMQLDLRSSQPLYRGHSELLVRDRWKDISARYRPLFTQGISIGETAQTLGRNELFIGIYGHLSYGLAENWTVGALLTGYLVDSPNGNVKWKFFEGTNDTVSFGTTITKTRDSAATAVNFTVYWDSITSDKMISHTLATFAAATLENVEDTVAIKTAGTSSLQTGYEFILDSWDRVLFGPSYNFESKSIGGYLAYKWIWDQFHVSTSLSTVDLRELKLDPKKGYVALVEAYWRF